MQFVARRELVICVCVLLRSVLSVNPSLLAGKKNMILPRGFLQMRTCYNQNWVMLTTVLFILSARTVFQPVTDNRPQQAARCFPTHELMFSTQCSCSCSWREGGREGGRENSTDCNEGVIELHISSRQVRCNSAPLSTSSVDNVPCQKCSFPIT